MSGFVYLIHDSLKWLKLHLLITIIEVAICALVLNLVILSTHSSIVAITIISLNLMANMAYGFMVNQMVTLAKRDEQLVI